METDDGGDATGFETVVQHAANGRLELFQFSVDGNSQRLKHARGRMTAPRVRLASRGAASGRARPGDRVGQIAAGANRLPAAPGDEIAGHPAAVRFFAVALEDIDELLF